MALNETRPRDSAVRLAKVDLTLGSGPSRVHVLKGIDLEVDSGSAVGIVGPSGSGKSTLLMVMAGLERVDSGTVEVAGTNITHMSEDALARFRGRHIGFVFQAFHLMQTMTALENVAVPLELSGDDQAFDKAAQALDRVGLSRRQGHYPGQMSGGEQQRVAIARALVPEPRLLIADEPTGNLDEATGLAIADLMFEAADDHGTTLVLVTHNAQMAERCGRVVRVSSGRLGENAAPLLRAAE